ncbi:Ubiquitin-associated domain-containing protein 2 [Orchesella cincta]|uniref:Ubiquitin-associated domain-containing protein 2 n=1 Tax=Orchesella cincta TaxID=48709 RepID=A0A1D2NEQ6_ORCCI|nr:Ubiquitin-associated domain-containing protein 2 [Orchesella cincta]
MLSQQSTTGFYKAPVCKGLLGCMFLTCTAIHVPMIAHLRQYLACQIPQVIISGQIWRLLFSRLTYVHTKDLICSALVIYYFRIFERRMGSRKFSSYLLGTCTIATILEICTIMLLSQFEIDYHSGGYLPPGLYGLIFPLYVNYFLDIPRIAVSSFIGIPVTGKTVTYLLGLQIASTSHATVISALCGLVSGILYRKNIFKVQKWLVVPCFIAKSFDKLFGWLLNSSEPKYKQMGATLELQRQEQTDLLEQQYYYNRTQEFRQQRGQGYSERLVDDGMNADGILGYFLRQRQRPTDNMEPSQENIQILVDMGFEHARAVEALRSSSNDLETATSILLRQ